MRMKSIAIGTTFGRGAPRLPGRHELRSGAAPAAASADLTTAAEEIW